MPKQAVHLPFGQYQAQTLDSAIAYEKLMAQLSNCSSHYKPINSGNEFYSRTAKLLIKGLQLTGIACAPMQTDVTAQDSVICIPFSGVGNRSVVNGKAFEFNPGEQALYCPEGRRVGTGGERSVFFAHIDKNRLRRTLAAMGGADSSINLDDPTTLRLQTPGVSFDQAIRSLCRLVDQFQGQQTLLDLSGIDDNFYRVFGMMFSPDLLGCGAAPGASSAPGHALSRVCDFIVANLHRPLTLTDLEEVAGLSARALQLQFLKQFGCSPMAWLRDQRLEVAHQRLLHDAYASVTQVALDVGFASPSRFAAAYKAKFGLLPSENRKNSY